MNRRWLLIAILASWWSILFSQEAAIRLTGVPNFVRVDDYVYRGGQPTNQGLAGLAKAGIKTVIDLRNGTEQLQPEKSVVEALGMRYVHVPMRSLEAPQDNDVRRVLALLDSREPVFVHCRRGKDRTGTVIACYRIEHDKWPNQKALAEAKASGMSSFEWDMQRFILHFEENAWR